MRSDEQGRFTLSPEVPGAYQLATLTAERYLPYAPEWGHSPWVVALSAGRRVTGVTLYVSPEVEYSGRVTTPDGKPATGATVRLLGLRSADQALLPFDANYGTDSKGEFRFSALDGAVLEARHKDYSPGRARVDFSAQLSHRQNPKLGVWIFLGGEIIFFGALILTYSLMRLRTPLDFQVA